MRRELPRGGADELRRRHEQNRIRLGKLRDVRGGLDAGIERYPRQIDAIGVMRVDLFDCFGLVGPERHIAARAPERLGECRPPRAAANHAHALKDLPRGGRRRVFRICAHDPMLSLARCQRACAPPLPVVASAACPCKRCQCRAEDTTPADSIRWTARRPGRYLNGGVLHGLSCGRMPAGCRSRRV